MVSITIVHAFNKSSSTLFGAGAIVKLHGPKKQSVSDLLYCK